MNAYLFAAGNGLRLRPLTDDVQKCMLPVMGKPMLEWWLDAVFQSECFDKVFVNVHHKADDVESWLKAYSWRKSRRIQVIDERAALLGTARTLAKWANIEDDFMTVYTDTFSHETMRHLQDFVEEWDRQPESVVAGLLSFDVPGDGSAGVMLHNREGIVTSFLEKSASQEGWAWAGVMFGGPKLLDEIGPKARDIARDVLAGLTGHIKIIGHVDAYDIGRGVEHYEHFNKRIRA